MTYQLPTALELAPHRKFTRATRICSEPSSIVAKACLEVLLLFSIICIFLKIHIMTNSWWIASFLHPLRAPRGRHGDSMPDRLRKYGRRIQTDRRGRGHHQVTIPCSRIKSSCTWLLIVDIWLDVPCKHYMLQHIDLNANNKDVLVACSVWRCLNNMYQ